MSAIKSIGEIALRVTDLATMVDFYQNVIGLSPMRIEKHMAFFNIADGHEGHTQVLAMFDRSKQDQFIRPEGTRSTIDHIAFNISLADLGSEKQRLESLGLTITTANHHWVKWRSLYVVDPEGNTVEFVCYDETMSEDEKA